MYENGSGFMLLLRVFNTAEAAEGRDVQLGMHTSGYQRNREAPKNVGREVFIIYFFSNSPGKLETLRARK